MKKRNLKQLSLNKKSIAKLMFEIKGARQDASVKRTKSALPLCPGCPTIPGMDPQCDIQQR
ncbi:hypothetical protein [uncultured Kordia sp.]|uniref:hypothetical protein n=1 Tax=uncultured Kordia sp. TaxID=507699 RepID=UPI00260D279F|nr:hypothetical protein [uncultured Kordia sp.]